MPPQDSVTPDIAGLRALAHPTRLRMLGLLRVDGPATATTLAARLDLNTGQTSYHLRQLAKHGFVVEDAERGNARDRWWRAAHRSTYTDSASRGGDDQGTVDAYLQSIAVVHAQSTHAAIEERQELPVVWRKASTYSDYIWRLTPDKGREVVERITDLLAEYEDMDDPDAAPFTVQYHAFPRPGHVPPAAPEEQ